MKKSKLEVVYAKVVDIEKPEGEASEELQPVDHKETNRWKVVVLLAAMLALALLIAFAGDLARSGFSFAAVEPDWTISIWNLSSSFVGLVVGYYFSHAKQ